MPVNELDLLKSRLKNTLRAAKMSHWRFEENADLSMNTVSNLFHGLVTGKTYRGKKIIAKIEAELSRMADLQKLRSMQPRPIDERRVYFGRNVDLGEPLEVQPEDIPTLEAEEAMERERALDAAYAERLRLANPINSLTISEKITLIKLLPEELITKLGLL
jgi:hypothetical protein